jgi:hypothetical protein
MHEWGNASLSEKLLGLQGGSPRQLHYENHPWRYQLTRISSKFCCSTNNLYDRCSHCNAFKFCCSLCNAYYSLQSNTKSCLAKLSELAHNPSSLQHTSSVPPHTFSWINSLLFDSIDGLTSTFNYWATQPNYRRACTSLVCQIFPVSYRPISGYDLPGTKFAVVHSDFAPPIRSYPDPHAVRSLAEHMSAVLSVVDREQYHVTSSTLNLYQQKTNLSFLLMIEWVRVPFMLIRRERHAQQINSMFQIYTQERKCCKVTSGFTTKNMLRATIPLRQLLLTCSPLWSALFCFAKLTWARSCAESRVRLPIFSIRPPLLTLFSFELC